MPPPPSGSRGPNQPKTLVGGLPWEKPAEPKSEFETGPLIVPGMPMIDAGPASAGKAHTPTAGLAEPRSLLQRIDGWVRTSPPFSVSLSVHVVAILGMALMFAPAKDEPKIKIDLSFAAEEIVEDEEKGVQVVAPEEPEQEPKPEVAQTEEAPVEEPIAAPAMVEQVVDEGAGATVAVVPQHVPFGSLLDGRQEGRREALVRAFGGSDATEAAVARALVWLAKQQRKDGLWSLQGPYLDGGSKENLVAATAMALLAFQGTGNTPTEGRHKKVVAKAWQTLLKKQLADGTFDEDDLPATHWFYTHGQATYAICELLGMTKDPAFAEPAQRAISYAVKTQCDNGGWRYEPDKDGKPDDSGDMSVTGWMMMALMSGKIAGLDVPQDTLDGITRFLDSVSVDGGGRYGYRLEAPQRPPAQVTAATSAEGLLSRQFLGWARDDRRISAGIERLLADRFLDYENKKDVYAWYYITQVAHNVGGEVWDRWNGRMREVLPANQVQNGPEAGSWDPADDQWGFHGGRLFTTCFCTYMLEVYYRHLPLYQAVAE